MKLPLSVVITAYNEEEKISEALESVMDIADEIIVVDNNSTDKTSVIAKKYTKHIFIQKNNPEDIDRQKNFGFSKASKEWTLSLDADERVTPALAEEIRQVLGKELYGNDARIVKGKSKDVKDGQQSTLDDTSFDTVQRFTPSVNGYWIPRKNFIFGKWIEHTGWYPDFHLRLFKTGKGKFVKEHVHEDIVVDGEKEYLHTDLLHQHYESIHQFIARNLLVYAKNEARAKIENGYVFSYADVLWFPAREFLSRYFAREGYKDGFHGLVLSLLLSAYHLAIFVYIWEEKGFVQENFTLKQFGDESQKIAEETRYWTFTSKIQNEKNPLKKTMLKIKKKIK